MPGIWHEVKMFDEKEKQDEAMAEAAAAEASGTDDEAAPEAPETADAAPEPEPEPEAAPEPAPLPDQDEDLDPESLFLDLPDEPVTDEEEAPAAEAPSADAAADALASELGLDEDVDLLDSIEIEIPVEDQAEIERRSKMRWFTIHANTGHENKVKRNIEMAIKSNHMEEHFGDILVPIQEVTEMKNGKRITSKRKFLPGYLLVEMVMTKETQHFINNIPGVTGFIGGTPLKPEPVDQDEIDRILGRISAPEEGKETIEIPYKVGDSVQVMDGPFSDWIGVINEINHEKGKLKVMISIFGKETPVELDFLQVKNV